MTKLVPPNQPYSMTLNLNVLNHLGINLYSNVAAVVAETVANSWDADARKVTVAIDLDSDRIEIVDDGDGMDKAEINDRYLMVGYKKREDPKVPPTTALGRRPMGRKGIGKLSLFSIAERIEVHTKKKSRSANAFVLDVADIQQAISRNKDQYNPRPISPDFQGSNGTKLILTRLKSRVDRTIPALRRRLSRRFGIIGAKNDFCVAVDGREIGPADRDYYHKIEYVWYYGAQSKWVINEATNAKGCFQRPNVIEGGLSVSGWIATANEVGQLKDEFKENLNRIVIMARDKLAQEDILEDFGEGGVYSKYIFGELNANFLDEDDELDISTSNRQRIIEDDPRYVALQEFVYGEVKKIKNEWNRMRAEHGTARAEEIPAIRQWLTTLAPDLRRQAEGLFGKINQVPVEDESEKNTLFAHGVLAFETFRYRNSLDKLDTVTVDNLPLLKEVFGKLDDIEATLYYQITRERLEMIARLQQSVETNALEKVIQQHLFDHLWLLDPSWDRATEQVYREQQVKTAIAKVDARLTPAERKARLDLRYKKISGKHVVIELKRPEVAVRTTRLCEQIRKYNSALTKVFRKMGDDGPMEFICLLGKDPTDWKDPSGQQKSTDLLKVEGARIVFYQTLLDNAHTSYKDYIEKQAEAGRVFSLIQQLDPQYFT